MKKTTVLYMILLKLLVGFGSVQSRESPLLGFYDGSKMELVFHLYILPEHQFAASFIYGSEDRLLFGIWKKTGENSIILEEQRPAEDPFVVYTAKGSIDKSWLKFKYFDQNTEVAMAFGPSFQADSLQYILKPDEYSFSYSYEMEMPDKAADRLYLSRQLSDVDHEVYAFQLPKGGKEVVLMYNAQTEKPLFNATAHLINDKLFLGMDNQEEEPFAKRQDLPKGIPEKRQIKMDDEVLDFVRLKKVKVFKTQAIINSDQSYFGNETSDQVEDVTTPVPTNGFENESNKD